MLSNVAKYIKFYETEKPYQPSKCRLSIYQIDVCLTKTVIFRLGNPQFDCPCLPKRTLSSRARGFEKHLYFLRVRADDIHLGSSSPFFLKKIGGPNYESGIWLANGPHFRQRFLFYYFSSRVGGVKIST